MMWLHFNSPDQNQKGKIGDTNGEVVRNMVLQAGGILSF